MGDYKCDTCREVLAGINLVVCPFCGGTMESLGTRHELTEARTQRWYNDILYGLDKLLKEEADGPTHS